MSTWSDVAVAAADSTWPIATLDPLARARTIAAALPGAVAHEVVLDKPFDVVWGFIADLDRSVPVFDRTVMSLRTTFRNGSRLRAVAWSGWRFAQFPIGFDIDLEDGWCWMVSRPRGYIVCMAATPDAADPRRTRYLHVEGLARGGRLLSRVLRGTRGRTRRHVAADVAGIARCIGATATWVEPDAGG